ncbi:DUF3602 domain-containing protein [Aspergillus puulaauensis]|uniref:Uncharacterized protein n=1 Tax=Aspergillus puulaauensis TaxID=1220207 RepID=A0A7R8AM43_9EURO|nr:uncharacterized protein APUU_30525S [Aspergillus puulaauensis]BCS22300.1 hypothetical protein APUU_30525S [Aspergillus puulaauensis]
MVEHSAPIVSHGRGGQGNIGPDSNEYIDGGIVREGPIGDQGDGAYSAGRGGAGNIGSPHVKPTAKIPHDAEFIPEISVRQSMEGDYHTGRGGQGNVHLDPEQQRAKDEKKEEKAKAKEDKKAEKAAGATPEGLADKLKYKIFGKK